MTERTGSDFQVTIVSSANHDDGTVERHSGSLERPIDELEGVWDTVIERLSALASKSQTAAERSRFDLNTITFNLGIEAGLSVGLVSKGSASVAITFTRKDDGKPAD